MKNHLPTLLIISLLLLLRASTYGQTVISYEYDANGNRVLRKVVQLRIKQQNDTIVSQAETLALLEEEKNEEPQEKTEAVAAQEAVINDETKHEEKTLTTEETSNSDNPSTTNTTAINAINNNTHPSNTPINPAENGVTALADQVSIYPNPTRGALSIQGNTNQTTIQLQLRDMNGKLITTAQLAPQANQQINMRNQPNGNYLLQLINPAGQTETITIIKTE